MNIPPAAEFLGKCVALVTGIITLRKALKEELNALSKRVRTVVAVVVLLFAVGMAAWFSYGMLHKKAANATSAIPAPAQPKSAPAAPPAQASVRPKPAATPPPRRKPHSNPPAQPATVNSAPNGFAVSGGTLTNPTVNNNYAAPTEPPGPNNKQLADEAQSVAKSMRKSADDMDAYTNFLLEGYAHGKNGPPPQGYMTALQTLAKPVMTEARELRPMLLGKLPPQPEIREVDIALDPTFKAEPTVLRKTADYFDDLARQLTLK